MALGFLAKIVHDPGFAGKQLFPTTRSTAASTVFTFTTINYTCPACPPVSCHVPAVLVLSSYSFFHLSLSTLVLNKVFSHFLFLRIDMLVLVHNSKKPKNRTNTIFPEEVVR